jgi:SAM-dependent methyltransferase
LTEWYKNKEFWSELRPFLFSSLRWISAADEVDQGLKLLRSPHDARILDIPCGPGRHALEFARRGYRVTAVDLMPFYVEEGRRWAGKEGLEVEFLTDDMYSFVRPDAFDVIWNYYSSFGYCSDPADDQKVMDNFFRSLAPGGAFLMEAANYDHVLRFWKSRKRFEHDPVEGVTVTEESILNKDGYQLMKWHVQKDAANKEFDITLRHYTSKALTSLMKNSGFKSVKLYGDISGSPYTPESERMVVVATKE